MSSVLYQNVKPSGIFPTRKIAQNTLSKTLHKNRFVDDKTINCKMLFGHFQVVQHEWNMLTWRFLDGYDCLCLQASVCLERAFWVWRRALCLICWPGPSPGISSAWRGESRLYACSYGWATRATWRNSWTWNGWKRKVTSPLKASAAVWPHTKTCLQLSVLFQNVFISLFIKVLQFVQCRFSWQVFSGRLKDFCLVWDFINLFLFYCLTLELWCSRLLDPLCSLGLSSACACFFHLQSAGAQSGPVPYEEKEAQGAG